MTTNEQHRAAYMEEAYELLAELETSLLELEDNPENSELIGRIFRALHTIKGSGSMFGFDDIVAFTHEVETAFDTVRNGLLPVTKELIDLTLSSRDHIKTLLEDPDSADKQRATEIISSLNKLSNTSLSSADDKSETAPATEASTAPESLENEITYRIRFKPPQDIFIRGMNPVHLINELHLLGDCKIVAQTDATPMIDDINPELCFIYWDISLTTTLGLDAIKDVFIFIEDECELDINIIHECSEDDDSNNATKSHKRIGDILLERNDISQESLQKSLAGQKPIGEMLVDAGLLDSGKVESALSEQEHVKNTRKKVEKAENSAASIRVSSDKLDNQVNLVGELVTVQARLTRLATNVAIPELLLIAEEVERLTEELRDNTMSVRMVPIGAMFSKFKRLVRDLSEEVNKEIQLTIEGADTELDKTVVDQLNDPLVHLIRNSVDHGIENSATRKSNGKPELGMLHLSARYSGANVLIEITDDGAGLDAETIRAKGIEKGLINQDAELTEKEIFALILAPGFSTAQTITNVSGRGVGMDVVKRNIEKLRGSIEISSKKGSGTTITLTLPLTLAIIDGLLVKIGTEFFVLPLLMVEECVELTDEDIRKAHGRQIANVRGEIVPYISLREQFAINGGTPEIEQIVITSINNQRVGFVVDHVIGEHQTVIKSLGKVYKDIEGVSGATIMGDGTVALILDALKLAQMVERKATMKA